jgi:UDP-N-acetylmuramyl pentapeptide phosphotransferase/UDP-N-acetylglucosamine-1-phosphate transferase
LPKGEKHLLSLLTIAVAFAASTGLTYAFIRWLTARRIVATENHRTMHKGDVPTGAGWPLLTAALVTAILIWPLAQTHLHLVLAIPALALISWIDDIRTVAPAPRLIVHIAAAAILLLLLPGDALVFQGLLPTILDRLATGLALIWFLNLYNFMDGIDGLAGVETITIAFGYAAIAAVENSTGPLYGLALATAAATAGFLVWNWAPAKIFLGDVGAVPLGFLLGALMIDAAVHHSLASALILPLYFVSDATLTLAKRVLNGKRPWDAHREHFYQRAVQGMGSHASVVVRVAVTNSILIILAVLALSAPGTAFLLAAATVGVLLVNLEICSRRKPAIHREGGA